MAESTDSGSPDTITTKVWSNLYRVGGVAALLATIVFRRNLGAELMAFKGFGVFNIPESMPVSAFDWFTILQQDKIVGLVLFGVVDLLEYALLGLIFLALYVALRHAGRSPMLVGVTSGLIGIAVYFASDQAFAMLSLSEKYSAVTGDIQRSMFLAAGEALLAISNPGTIHQGMGIYISLFLVLLAGLIISIVMLHSEIFSTASGIVGILANGIGLLYFVAIVFAPMINWVPPTVSAPFRLIWYILIAITLFKLGKVGKYNG